MPHERSGLVNNVDLKQALICCFQVSFYAVVKVNRILPDLRSGAQSFYYGEIRGPIDINNAPGDISWISQGP